MKRNRPTAHTTPPADNELQRLLSEAAPEVPQGFGDRVMQQIEALPTPEAKPWRPPISRLGWLFIALLVAAFVVLAAVSGNSGSTPSLPMLQWLSTVQLPQLPGWAYVLSVGASFLLLAERFVAKKVG